MRRSIPLMLLVVSCSPGKPEAASLIAGVERFHRASNEERPARAEALAAVACTEPSVCEVKTACVAATSETAEALRMKEEAEAILADLQAGRRTKEDPAVAALPAKLDRASTLLEKGHDDMPACDRQILRLRSHYGL